MSSSDQSVSEVAVATANGSPEHAEQNSHNAKRIHDSNGDGEEPSKRAKLEKDDVGMLYGIQIAVMGTTV